MLSCVIGLLAFHCRLAADENIIGYLLNLSTKGLEIYAVLDTSETWLIAMLPDKIALANFGTAEWSISSASDIQLSPDGDHVAFVATWSTSNETSLFIYTFPQNALLQREIPEASSITWSPGSDALLLNGNTVLLYDLATDQFAQIAENPFQDFQWLPDNQHLIYVDAGLPCEAPCQAYNDLFVVNRDGTNNHAVTNLGTQIPKDVFHSICAPTWSAWNRRIYYRVGCITYGLALEYVYSTDLFGDNRLENAPTGFNPAYDSRRIVSLNVDDINRTLYASISENRAGDLYWRVIRFNSTGEIQTIFESSRTIDLSTADLLRNSNISPDGHNLAINAQIAGEAETGLLQVINANNGQSVLTRENLQIICHFYWIDDRRLVLTQEQEGVTDCYEPFPVPPRTLWMLDTISGNMIQLASDLPATSTFFISFGEYRQLATKD